MLYLLLAIFGSGVIPVVFRGFESWRINLFWAIPINYIVCVSIGGWLAANFSIEQLSSSAWLPFAAVQGILLAVNFFLLARTAQRAGVAIAALASRLSVAIPSVLAFTLYGDSMTSVKFAGLSAALLALYLCTAPEKNAASASAKLIQGMPLLVFATFGVYFTILKYLQTYYLDAESYHSYVMSGFVCAFLTSAVIGAAMGVFRAADFRLRHALAGILLGVINYLAVYALLQVLALRGWQSSQLFPIYSVGVVAVSTVLAFVCFGEKLSARKSVGLAVGAMAVALLNR